MNNKMDDDMEVQEQPMDDQEIMENEDIPSAIDVYTQICAALKKYPNKMLVSSLKHNDVVLFNVDYLLHEDVQPFAEMVQFYPFNVMLLYGEDSDYKDDYNHYYSHRPPVVMPQKMARVQSASSTKKGPLKPLKHISKSPKVLSSLMLSLGRNLTENNNLETIKLSGLTFSATGMKNLAEGLKKNQTLGELHINYCNISAKELDALSKGLNEILGLHLLDLSHNNIDNKCGTIIGNMIGAQGQRKDELLWYGGLRGENFPPQELYLAGLFEIDLSYNPISDGFIRDVTKVLRNDKWIRAFNLKGNNIGRDGMIELIDLLANFNESLITLNLTDNPGLTPEISSIILDFLARNHANFKESSLAHIQKLHELYEQQEAEDGQGQYDENGEYVGDEHEPHMDQELQAEVEQDQEARHHFQEMEEEDNHISQEQGLIPEEEEEAEDEENQLRSEDFAMSPKSPPINQGPFHDDKRGRPISSKQQQISPPQQSYPSHQSSSKKQTQSSKKNQQHVTYQSPPSNQVKKNRPLDDRQSGTKVKMQNYQDEEIQYIEDDQEGGEQCPNCRELEKEILRKESKYMSVLLENSRLKKEVTMLAGMKSSSSKKQKSQKAANVNEEETMAKVELLMKELARLMDSLEDGGKGGALKQKVNKVIYQ